MTGLTGNNSTRGDQPEPVAQLRDVNNMCGICGVFSTRPDPGLFNALNQSLDRAAHRGPDGRGALFGRGSSVIDDPANETPDWGLGHVRLAILDLSENGRQPMEYGGGRFRISYNGEVYNYLELKRDLEKLGHRFTTDTDTEVVLAAYREWGESCLDRFIGMFAFILVDLEAGSVFLARDRLGVKPLYIWSHGPLTAVVSEPKQLAAFPGFQAAANPNAVLDFLVDGVLDHDRSGFFKGVYPLPGGHSLSFPLGTTPDPDQMKAWWTPQNKTEPMEWEEFVGEFGGLFRDSVRLRMRSDVEVGSCLSGGLDSSSIVGYIGRELGRTIHSFSICFDEKPINEQPYINAVNQLAGCRPHRIFPRPDDALENLEKVVYHQDEPFGSLSIFAQWMLMQAARKAGVPVLLDGQGGDEILCGYRKYAVFYLRRLLAGRQYASGAGHIFQVLANGDRSFTDIQSAKRYMPLFLKKKLDPISSILTPPWKSRRRYPLSAEKKKRFELSDYQIRDILHWSIPILLRYEDRNSMAHGIEARVPFLDHRLVELCLSAPAGHFFQKGRTKRVLTEAMGNSLPRIVKERRTKLGFETPQKKWINGPVGKMLIERVSGNPGLREIVDLKSLKTGASRTGLNAIGDQELFRLAGLALWLDAFNVDLDAPAD